MGSLAAILRPRRGRKRAASAVLAVLLVGWLAGLVSFAARIPEKVADTATRTDVIVVLTGGSRRVETGLRLLAAGLADRMFVSGVYPETSVAELLARTDVADTALAARIEVGRSAQNTAGNAAETADWIRAHDFHSLRLVTSSYHMPRSLLELRRALPNVEVVPHPVFPARVDTEGWWQRPATALLIAEEYSKYLVAKLGHAISSPPETRATRD